MRPTYRNQQIDSFAYLSRREGSSSRGEPHTRDPHQERNAFNLTWALCWHWSHMSSQKRVRRSQRGGWMSDVSRCLFRGLTSGSAGKGWLIYVNGRFICGSSAESSAVWLGMTLMRQVAHECFKTILRAKRSAGMADAHTDSHRDVVSAVVQASSTSCKPTTGAVHQSGC